MKIPRKSDSEIRDKIKKLTGKDASSLASGPVKPKAKPQLEKPNFVSPDANTPAVADTSPKVEAPKVETPSAPKVEAPSAPKVESASSPKIDPPKAPIEDKVEIKSQHMQKNPENLTAEDKLNEVNPGIRSDIGLNRAGDPETQEKLKALLKNGGFNFSESERKALSSILNKP